MHVNRTRIILIVMIVATVVLGVAAIFIGWRLQSQVNTKSFAGGECDSHGGIKECAAACTTPGSEGCYSVRCNDNTTHDINGGSGSCPANNGGGQSGNPVGNALECTKICCGGNGGEVGCVQARYSNGTFNINGGPGSCLAPNAVRDGASCPAVTGGGSGGTGSGSNPTTLEACNAANGCWNDSSGPSGGCTLPGSEWCGPGNCVAGRTDLCKYRCTNKVAVNTNTACVAGSCQAGYCLSVSDPNGASFGECVAGSAPSQPLCVASSAQTCKLCDCSADNRCDYNNGQECRKNCRTVACNVSIPNCAQLDFNCQAGGDCGGSNINKCANCTTPPGTTSSSTSSITTQNTCYKCTDAEDDGNTCQTQTTAGTCASLGAGWTSNSLCETGATGGSCTAAIQAKVRGRVYCQDTSGPLIPIPNTVVAITKGSTTINATTDADGFYVSSNIGLPSSGDKVGVDIGSLPATFNNGLNTSQLTGKSALNCASTSSLPGCSTGVASNYYCNSVSTKSSYANCKITTVGNTTFGHGGFDFKYTNCTAIISSCGDSVVDSGEACDPVGTVGQCSSGGKCQTGCACPTCNSTCSTNDDCPDGLVCSNNSCRNPSNKSAVDCKAGTTSIPSTGLLDENLPVIVASFVLMILGLLTVRNQGAVTLMTNVAISLFGTNILRYVDPAGAKRYYEKNILSKQKNEAK